MLSICCNIHSKSWRITKIKPFINKHKWEGLNFPSEKDNWKKTEKNNVTVAFNVLCVKKEEIYPTYVSKNNSSSEKQIIILIVLNGKGWGQHYLAIKKISIIKRNNIRTKKTWERTNLNSIKKHMEIKVFVMYLSLLKTLKY